MSRAERSSANRDEILSSARRHFEQFGYHGASVDAIAADAGFSKGAIYSQFGSKDELMLAVLEVSIADRQRASERLIESFGTDVRFDDVMRDAFGASRQSPGWQAALAEFRIHAWRHPALNARYRAAHERTVENVASVVAEVVDRLDVAIACEPADLAVALLTLNTGLVVESFLDGDTDVVDVVRILRSLMEATATTDGPAP